MSKIKALDTTLTYEELVNLVNVGLPALAQRRYSDPGTTMATVLIQKLVTPHVEAYTEALGKIAPPLGDGVKMTPQEQKRRETAIGEFLKEDVTIARLPRVPLARLYGIQINKNEKAGTQTVDWTASPELDMRACLSLLPIVAEDGNAVIDVLQLLADVAEDEVEDAVNANIDVDEDIDA